PPGRTPCGGHRGKRKKLNERGCRSRWDRRWRALELDPLFPQRMCKDRQERAFQCVEVVRSGELAEARCRFAHVLLGGRHRSLAFAIGQRYPLEFSIRLKDGRVIS